jgi:hypothetical protein
MISRTLGAFLGGTTVAGQQDLESLALRLITPPNAAGGLGRYAPLRVVVALGEQGTPLVCCAARELAEANSHAAAKTAHRALVVRECILISCGSRGDR